MQRVEAYIPAQTSPLMMNLKQFLNWLHQVALGWELLSAVNKTKGRAGVVLLKRVIGEDCAEIATSEKYLGNDDVINVVSDKTSDCVGQEKSGFTHQERGADPGEGPHGGQVGRFLQHLQLFLPDGQHLVFECQLPGVKL